MNLSFVQLRGARTVPGVFFWLALLGAVSALNAETVFTGRVLDAVTKAPISGVSIFVGVDAGLGESDAQGAFSFPLTQSGVLDVRAFKVGYELAFIEGTAFRPDGETTLQIQLLPVGGGIPLVRDPNEPREEIAPGVGSVAGQITDLDTEDGIAGVRVELRPGPLLSSTVSEDEWQVATTDGRGRYSFSEVESGYYSLRFMLEGYRGITLEDVAVKPGEEAEWSVPLTPLADAGEGEVFDLGEFVVSAEKITQQQFDFQVLREQSVNLVDLLSAEDFSRFAAADIAAAITKVPGVTVVEGQFAVIRGLTDRYSSTSFNGATLPSPDPDRQGVQLDLFPASQVTTLAVSKTFSPDLGSNSGGGAINIIAPPYSEEFTGNLKLGVRFNSDGWNRFSSYDGGGTRDLIGFGGGERASDRSGITADIPVTADAGANISSSLFGKYPLGLSLVLNVADKTQFRKRDLRFFLGLSYDSSFSYASGTEQSRSAGRGGRRRPDDLNQGLLSVSEGVYDYEKSEASVLLSLLLGADYTLDSNGRHQVSGVGFWSQSGNDAVFVRGNGRNPGEDDPVESPTIAGFLREVQAFEQNNDPQGGDEATFEDTLAYKERNLTVLQLLGKHEFLDSRNLKANWALNYAETYQDEPDTRRTRYWFDPSDGRFEVGSQNDLGIVMFRNFREIQEVQDFAAADIEYTDSVSFIDYVLTLGGTYESSSRTVEDSSVRFEADQTATESSEPGVDGTVWFGETARDLFRAVYANDLLEPSDELAFSGNGETSRTLSAGFLSGRFTFFQWAEISGGARIESLELETQGNVQSGVFPVAQFYEANGSTLGFEAGDPFDRGLIERDLVLPSANITLRPPESALVVRFSYSQTVARPSFRELSPYISLDPLDGDWVVGNVALKTSDVESWDLRVEYVDDSNGDLIALSSFYKTIEDPIESTLIYNNVVGQTVRTWFNNPNAADLSGYEVEIRKSLDFIPGSFFEHLTIGGNYTRILASVKNPDSVIEAYQTFYYNGLDPNLFQAPPAERRLFDQPSWILNADLSYDNESLGLKVTLIYFAISDVLQTAGNPGTDNRATIDIYTDKYDQVDLVVEKTLKEDWSIKFSVKNLTDSERRQLYDPSQTVEVLDRRAVKSGPSFSISTSWGF
jgi:hypothetical protein